MSLLSEFKEFANRGSVVDLAVGVVIGGAFGKIISSFVSDVLMPPLGLLLGNVDMSDVSILLKNAVMDGETVVTKAVSLNIGVFLGTVIDFVIIAFAIFMVIRGMNSMKRKKVEAPAAPPEPTEDVLLLREIRDSLRKS